jgi:hypothetical protein
MKRSNVLMLAALGLVGSVAGLANAQPYAITLSGATLLENFLKAPASTNEFIDINGNTVLKEQLAPTWTPAGGFNANQWWVTGYRAVGSVNGFQELVDFGDVFVTTVDGVDLKSTVASKAFAGTVQYINNGASSNAAYFNAQNPGALPNRAANNVTFIATTSPVGTPSVGGISVDIAPIDVPARWAVFVNGGTPVFTALPGSLGYGNNPRIPLNKDGTNSPFNNLLADLKDKNLFNPANPGAANNKTLFDTPIALAPVAALTNLGTGLQQIDKSDLRHLFATGRTKDGVNYVAVTRDAGSGTRNAFNNATCIDPSWGVGDNVGNLNVAADASKLGPDYLPNNKGGSGQMENTTISTRLGIGYSGAERGATGSSAWLTLGRLEVLGVRNDLAGGTIFARPTLSNILNNDNNGYSIAGPFSFVTLGNPKSAPINKGGNGSTLPAMKNVEAAAYLNNITLSVASTTANPTGPENLFTPGEFLLTQFILTAATNNVPDATNPCNLIPNPSFNQFLKDFTLASSNVLKNPAYATFGTVTLDGLVPDRKASTVYSDNNSGGNFVLQDGTTATYLTVLNSRNRIAGDFDGNGVRTLADAVEMIKAWNSRNGGPAWVAPNGTGPINGAPGAKASIEILGDFNSDGNFGRRLVSGNFVADTADVRYWADGLATVNGKLDRKAGFEAVDNAFGGNFFGTVWADGRAYTNGDSRFDVAGPSGLTTRGWAPTGADGIIDQADFDYVAAQFQSINPAGVDWTVTGEAVFADLSGDVTGDLRIDQADLDAFGLTACYPDCDLSGGLDINDFICFQTFYAIGDTYADCDLSGTLNIDDFICFQTFYALGC